MDLQLFKYGQILQFFLHLAIPLIILLGFTFLDGSFALISFCLIVRGLLYATNGGFGKFSFISGSWFIVLQCFCVIFVTFVTQFLKHLIWKPYPFFTLWCPLQWEPSTKVRMYFSSFGSLPMLYVWRLQAKSIYIPSLEGWTSKAHQKSEGIMGTLRFLWVWVPSKMCERLLIINQLVGISV